MDNKFLKNKDNNNFNNNKKINLFSYGILALLMGNLNTNIECLFIKAKQKI